MIAGMKKRDKERREEKRRRKRREEKKKEERRREEANHESCRSDYWSDSIRGHLRCSSGGGDQEEKQQQPIPSSTARQPIHLPSPEGVVEEEERGGDPDG